MPFLPLQNTFQFSNHYWKFAAYRVTAIPITHACYNPKTLMSSFESYSSTGNHTADVTEILLAMGTAPALNLKRDLLLNGSSGEHTINANRGSMPFRKNCSPVLLRIVHYTLCLYLIPDG